MTHIVFSCFFCLALFCSLWDVIRTNSDLNSNCAELTFFDYKGELIPVTPNQDIQIKFAVDWSYCLSESYELVIKISKKENGHLVVECKLTQTKTACSVSKTTTACSCLSETGPITFIKNLSRDVNVTYEWSWAYQGSDKKKRILTLMASADQTACKVRFSKGTNSADLACYFSEDIKQSQRDFGVYHFNGKGITDAVVDCLWQSEGLRCITKRNYEIDTSVTDRITVQIHGVTDDVSGTYSCQTSGMKREDVGFCELSTGETSCKIHAGGITSESTLRCHFSEDVGISKKDFSVYHFDFKGRPEAVVDCRWMSDNLRCSLMPGYHYDNAVTSSASVIIPKITQYPSGLYGCHITGTQLEEINLCEHSFTEETSCQIISNDTATDAQLTCFFNEDISHSKKNFFVAYFDDGGIKAETVVDCMWHKGDLNCSNLPGYQAATTVSNRFSVLIPRLSESQTGSYQCHVTGARPGHASPCGHRLNDRTTEDSDTCLEVAVPIIIFLGLTVIFLTILVLRQNFFRTSEYKNLNVIKDEDTKGQHSEASTSEIQSMESEQTTEPEMNPEVSQQSENHRVTRQRNPQVKIDNHPN